MYWHKFEPRQLSIQYQRTRAGFAVFQVILHGRMAWMISLVPKIAVYRLTPLMAGPMVEGLTQIPYKRVGYRRVLGAHPELFICW